MRGPWWRPLLSLSAEHLSIVRDEGLLAHLDTKSLYYRRAAESAESPELSRRLMRRAAMLREARVALEQAAT